MSESELPQAAKLALCHEFEKSQIQKIGEITHICGKLATDVL
jgi:hypothetical protein